MLWVGLTGGIASGKSTVAEMLGRAGYTVISADGLSHLAMAPKSQGAKQIRSLFGDAVFDDGDVVNRGRLGAIVFADTSGKHKAALEGILHPEVRRLAQAERDRLAKRGDKLAFYEIPLLFEKNLKSHFDKVVCVAVDPDVQLQRLMARAKLTEPEARARISSQLPQEQKVKQSDFVIWNHGDLTNLAKATTEVLSEIERFA